MNVLTVVLIYGSGFYYFLPMLRKEEGLPPVPMLLGVSPCPFCLFSCPAKAVSSWRDGWIRFQFFHYRPVSLQVPLHPGVPKTVVETPPPYPESSLGSAPQALALDPRHISLFHEHIFLVFRSKESPLPVSKFQWFPPLVFIPLVLSMTAAFSNCYLSDTWVFSHWLFSYFINNFMSS